LLTSGDYANMTTRNALLGFYLLTHTLFSRILHNIERP
jgi:hypothetical protein